MARSFLGWSKKQVSAEESSARVLNEVIACCPRCSKPLNGHKYRLIAATTLGPEGLDNFRELMAAIRKHEWQKVTMFQSWEGNQANAEVYDLKCPDGRTSVVVISTPFVLDEPYTLMHQEKVEASAPLETLPGSDTWHQL
jgi:hypothetical protein